MTLLLHLDREARVPLHEQIRAQVALLVDQSALATGTRLPSTRALSEILGVNRSTVYRAYQDLWAQGYLEARPGSYSTVRSRLRPPAVKASPTEPLLDFESLSAPGPRSLFPKTRWMAELASFTEDRRLINFSSLTADRELCPLGDIQRAFRTTTARLGKTVFEYGPPVGYLPLRQAIARNLRVHGVAVDADHVLITNGSQHGFDLLLRLFGRPGAAAVMEAPTYSLAIMSCQQQGMPIVTIPMRDDGMDLDALAARLKRGGVAFVYSMPNFHNPTGITTSQAHRERLLGLCESHRVPLIEDGFEEELKYFGHAILPIKSMDRRGVVIYLGTFSKVVFPGLRVGFIAAHPSCIERLAAVSRVCWLSGNLLTQAAIARFCDSGAYEEHIRRVHRAYRPRMRALLDSLTSCLPHGRVHFTRPQGGYTLLLTLRPRRRLNEEHAMQRFRDAGVLLSPGSLYFPSPPEQPCFRISVANLSVEKIQEGCRRLGLAVKGMV
jgi:DNA-binding transcriptional MocR family regulator